MCWWNRYGRLGALCLALAGMVGCGEDEGGADDESAEEGEHGASSNGAVDGSPSVEDLENVSEATADEETRRARAEALDREFPLHGLVTRPSLHIKESADPEALTIGWLRWGERIRLKREPETTNTCASGWYELAPRGWACAGEGIEVGEEPPQVEDEVPPAERDAVMPYS